MGTRAAFWLGDPRDIQNRQWLGCKAWDGYPEGLPELADVITADDFVAAVKKVQENNDDFASPDGGWPYPWDGDIFLTDYTYAFFNGQVQVACCHSGFVTWAEATDRSDPEHDAFEKCSKELPCDIPAPKAYDRSQPDSIIVVSA